MSLYSVMLVDDEEEVIQIIMKKLDWASMGFQIVGYAHNGAEALELAEECQPDVVMTDIKMPYMDGLELSRRLKERYPSIRIIIFSGFDEFEYAKEAIRIEVEEYILKPIDAGELQELFGRIKKSLDKEIDEKRNIDKLQEYYMESLPLLQENFFTSLFEGRVPAEEIDKYLVNYQIHLCGPLYLVTILHLSSSDVKAYSNPFLMTVSVKKLAEEQLVPKYGSRTLIYLGDIIVISQLETAEQVAGYTDMMDEFCRQAKRVCGVRVTAGVGQLCSSVEELKLSYQGARNAVSYRALYGNNRAINIAEIEPKGKVRGDLGGGSPSPDHEADPLGGQECAGGRGQGLPEEIYGEWQLSAEVSPLCYGTHRGDHALRKQKPAGYGRAFPEGKRYISDGFPAGILRGALRMAHRRG